MQRSVNMLFPTGRMYRRLVLMVFVLAFGLSPAIAQSTGTLAGRVTDAKSGDPLPGANVFILGTIMGTATDLDGFYSLKLPPGKYQVRINYISYKTVTTEVTVNAGETATNDVTLSTDYIGANEVVVLGTRRSGRTVVESPVPIDVISEEEIRASGMSETTQILQQLIPSYNAPRPSITDGSDHMRPATLRGLGPDQVLILVNGKRRHTSALVHVNGSVGRGSTGVDLNAIPASAIAKIEVLRDGAAAQYGSDAISGVINIVLKEKAGLDVSATYSQYYSSVDRGYAEDEGNRPDGDDAGSYDWDGTGLGGPESVTYKDGKAVNLHLGYGVPLGGGNLYLSAQLRSSGYANRAGLDPRQQYFDNDPREDNFDRLNHRYGNGEFDNASFFFNGNFPLGTSGTQFYTFGGYNHRLGQSGCFYRRANDNRTVRSIHPDGFLPILENTLQDVSVAAGVKGAFGSWAYDFSETFGTNGFDWGVIQSNNTSIGDDSPTEFDAGALKFAQATTNLDFFRSMDIGSASPLNVAIGAEFRYDNYKIEPGEEASYSDGGVAVLDGPNAGAAAAAGAQCFPGYSPRNETDTSRTNVGVYVDLENNLTSKFLVGVAGRFENYSDFGSTFTGKATGRFELTPELALRGGVSSGFRAPSLAQAYYSSIATNFINGVPFEVGTFPVNSPVARALGAQDLDAEKSVNLSAGVTFSKNNLSMTIDAYQIDIKDRVVFTENFTGSDIAQFLADRGINANGGRYFTNAVDTRTQGLDITGRIALPLGPGTFHFTAALNFNETEITNKDEIETPAEIQAVTTIPLFGRVEQGRFEVGQPKQKFNFTGNYDVNNFKFMLRTQFYGEVTELNSSDPDPATGVNQLDETFGAKWVTDFEAGYKLVQNLSIALGVENLFDVYPDKQIKANSFNGIFPYDGLSPFGFFGRSIYARLNFSR